MSVSRAARSTAIRTSSAAVNASASGSHEHSRSTQAHRRRRARVGAGRLDPLADPEHDERLQEKYGLTFVIISHDLSVVKYMSDRIGVMYLGKMVEIGSGDELYSAARAPVHARPRQRHPNPRP